MSATPVKLRLRTYNVGFGDAFLLTVFYDNDSTRHILIDFGTTALGTGPESTLAIAEKIAEHCDNKLHMVVATHRHADHISGFGGKAGEVIAGLNPDLVVQPWTEDPALEPDATSMQLSASDERKGLGLTTSLAAMQTVADAVAKEGNRLTPGRGLPKGLSERVAFLGMTNISNEAAVKNLAAMGPNVYAYFGKKLPIKTLLPGVKIDVLGPPTVKQEPGIARMASKDATEYWHLAAQRADRSVEGSAKPLFKKRKTIPVPQEAKWIVAQVTRAHTEEVLSIVRSLDSALNNTSLILLLEVAGKTLLFPGDAQIENWRYALFNADDSPAIRKRLAQTDVYKVGHHGSLNATPKTLWEGFKKKSTDEDHQDRLISLLSTKSGKHGESHRGTEVPRVKLVDALDANSTLVTTRRMRSKVTFWKDVVLDLT